MASKNDKDIWDDDEIIDLTDVVEEGSAAQAEEQSDISDQNTSQTSDQDNDLSDLFESLNAEKETGDSQDDDNFEDLFAEDSDKAEEPADTADKIKQQPAENGSEEEDFLKDFLEDDQDEDIDLANSKQDDLADIDDLIADMGDDEDAPEEAQNQQDSDEDDLLKELGLAMDDEETQAEDAPAQPQPEPETSVEEEDLSWPDEDDPEPPEAQDDESEPEPATEDVSEVEDEMLQEDQALREDPELPDELPPSEQEGPSADVDTLTEQMKSLSERMNIFEERIGHIESSFNQKAIEAVEEKGSDLQFFKTSLDELRQELQTDFEARIESMGPKTQDSADGDFKAGVVEAIEEKWLELNFIQELTDNISQKTMEMVDEKISAASSAPQALDESEVGLKIQELERKIQEIPVPDPEELKNDMRGEFEKILEQTVSDLARDEEPPSSHDSGDESTAEQESEPEQEPETTQDPGIDVLRQEMLDIIEEKVSTLIESWQNEKKALASELENALKFWGKIQEKVTVLSQDIGELRDKNGKPDPELLEKIESLSELAVTRNDLKNLAAQMKAELEEYIQKKVPEAAARVIREEIAAMMQEAQ